MSVSADYGRTGRNPSGSGYRILGAAGGGQRPPHPDAPALADALDGGQWAAFVGWAQRFYEDKSFSEQELTTTLQISDRLQRARGALLGGWDTWAPLLQRAFDAPNDITSRQTHNRFLRWCTVDAEADMIARRALRALWDESGAGGAVRIRTFLAEVPRSVVHRPASRLNVASFLLMAVDPLRYPAYVAPAFAKGYALTGSTPPGRGADEAEVYTHSLRFLDQLIKEASDHGLSLQHRLHAQRVHQCVTLREAPEGWSADQRRAFVDYRDHAATSYRFGRQPPSKGPAQGRRDGQEGEQQPNSLAELATALLFEQSELGKIERLLSDKGQVIFFGPPGTGKTYVARRLARWWAGSDTRVAMVQLHPSYAYEDFVEGYRPHLMNGQPGFSLVDGPLKRIAQAAREAPEQRHVLVIDELNRGNVAKVFGELYFLLEYRSEHLALQYSALPFALPKNLWIIGTMNTADRSIALVDLALRRRFYFVPFFPDEPPVAGLLRRWLERHARTLLWVADVVDRANQQLHDRQAAIGPSYFLKPGLTEEWVEMIWEHAVLPSIAEQCIGEEGRLRDFALDRLRADAASGWRRRAPRNLKVAEPPSSR